MAAAKKTTDLPAEAEELQTTNETVDSESQTSVSEEVTETTTKEDQEVKSAKAGKRSTKGLAEAEAKAEKLERQQHAEDKAEEAENSKPKQPVKPTRSRLERRGKGYRKSAELIEKGKVHSLKEAVELATKTSSVKFDASVELHVNLGVDPRQADQNIRANLVLPQGTGKTVRVAVFADEDIAGADMTGVEAVSKELEKGTIGFDVLISNPANMARLGKYARLLGPRGLMPNPKSGTVTADLTKAVSEAKAGRVEYRVDSTGIVHLAIGKVSFGPDKLLENANAVLASIRGAKPSSTKGVYMKAVHITTSMGPSIIVSAND